MSTNKFSKLFNEIEQEHKVQDELHRDSKVLIVDGMNLFIRAFAATPTLNEDGRHIGGLSGFLKSLAATIRLIHPTRVVVVFDGKGGSVNRRKILPDYKQRRAMNSRLNRVAGFEDVSDEQLSRKYQLLRVSQYLNELPITTMIIDDIEADDTIAYLCNYFKHDVVILSNDRDFLQLVSDRVRVYTPTKKKLYTPANLLEECGVWCENYAIYKALIGDKSDNIKGIHGLGDKTILKQFPMLGIESKIDVDEFAAMCMQYDGKIKSLITLRDNIETFRTNYKLMQLADVDIPSTFKSAIRNMTDGEVPALNKLELNKMYIQDKLATSIPNWDIWIRQNFTRLTTYRNIGYAG